MTVRKIRLGEFDSVVAVVPEHARGPGWTNAIVWVHVHNMRTGTLRTEAIQPEERTPEMHALFSVGAEMALALAAAVPTIKSE